MKKVILLLGVVLSLAILVRTMTRPTDVQARNSVGTNITINARVDTFSEWADPSPVIFQADWSGPINHINQKQTATKALVLYSNTDATIHVNPGLNNGILSNGSQTLDTAYRVTGAVTSPDSTFKPASQFFAAQNAYTVAHVQGTGAYTINIEVQMASPANAAPEEGVYMCGITLTAAW